ncbi:MAG: hypothetical protein AB8G05_01010 [Oligoflexales bacterium]
MRVFKISYNLLTFIFKFENGVLFHQSCDNEGKGSGSFFPATEEGIFRQYPEYPMIKDIENALILEYLKNDKWEQRQRDKYCIFESDKVKIAVIGKNEEEGRHVLAACQRSYENPDTFGRDFALYSMTPNLFGEFFTADKSTLCGQIKDTENGNADIFTDLNYLDVVDSKISQFSKN